MKDYIGYYENILTDDVCLDLIEYSTKMQLKPSTYSTSSGKSDRSKQRVKMDDVWFKEGQPFFKNRYLVDLKIDKRYKEQHELFRVEKHSGFRLNKYSEGGFMSRHVDITPLSWTEYGYPQVFLLFLNDDYEGGEFIISDIEYNPKQGSAIIFPSNFMFPHEVKTIKKGTRYLTWLM